MGAVEVIRRHRSPAVCAMLCDGFDPEGQGWAEHLAAELAPFLCAPDTKRRRSIRPAVALPSTLTNIARDGSGWD
jgi:hypothetical protein